MAIEQAVSTHPSVAAAQASARAAGAELRATKWQRFPSISVEGLVLNQPGNRLQAQAVIDQPLWTGGRISGSVRRASAQSSGAVAAYDEAVLSIASATAQAFYDVQRWRGRAAILALSLEQHQKMVASMQRRYEQDVSPLSDLELARSRMLQVEQQLLQAKSQEAAAASRVRELVGDPFWAVGALSAMPAKWPTFDDAVLIEQAVAFSPSLKRLRFEAQAASAQASVAQASILPQLSGQYTYSETFGHRFGVVLKAQTDGGFSKVAAASAAREKVRASEMQVAASERQLRDQVFALLRDYETSTRRLEGSMSAAGSAERVMESYMRQFASGRRTWLDVMNAVREANSAEIDALEARIAAQSSLARLLLLSGQWVPVPVEQKS